MKPANAEPLTPMEEREIATYRDRPKEGTLEVMTHAESGLGLEPEDGRSPDKLYDRDWALALLDKVLDGLAREENDFARWKPFLSVSSGKLSYAELAREFGMAEGAARVAVPSAAQALPPICHHHRWRSFRDRAHHGYGFPHARQVAQPRRGCRTMGENVRDVGRTRRLSSGISFASHGLRFRRNSATWWRGLAEAAGPWGENVRDVGRTGRLTNGISFASHGLRFRRNRSTLAALPAESRYLVARPRRGRRTMGGECEGRWPAGRRCNSISFASHGLRSRRNRATSITMRGECMVVGGRSGFATAFHSRAMGCAPGGIAPP